MKKRNDTNKAGAFLNLYSPIGNSDTVKDLSGDADLLADRAYILRALKYQHDTSKGTFVNVDIMCQEAENFIKEFKKSLSWK